MKIFISDCQGYYRGNYRADMMPFMHQVSELFGTELTSFGCAYEPEWAFNSPQNEKEVWNHILKKFRSGEKIVLIVPDLSHLGDSESDVAACKETITAMGGKIRTLCELEAARRKDVSSDSHVASKSKVLEAKDEESKGPAKEHSSTDKGHSSKASGQKRAAESRKSKDTPCAHKVAPAALPKGGSPPQTPPNETIADSGPKVFNRCPNRTDEPKGNDASKPHVVPPSDCPKEGRAEENAHESIVATDRVKPRHNKEVQDAVATTKRPPEGDAQEGQPSKAESVPANVATNTNYSKTKADSKTDACTEDGFVAKESKKKPKGKFAAGKTLKFRVTENEYDQLKKRLNGYPISKAGRKVLLHGELLADVLKKHNASNITRECGRQLTNVQQIRDHGLPELDDVISEIQKVLETIMDIKTENYLAAQKIELALVEQGERLNTIAADLNLCRKLNRPYAVDIHSKRLRSVLEKLRQIQCNR